MIEIRITDPHLMDKNEVFKLAKYLFEVSGNELRKAPNIVPVTECHPASALDNKPSLNVSDTVPTMELTQPSIPSFVPPPPVETQPTELNTRLLDLDIDGLPWDGRIHSRTKSKTVDGRWKLQRGVDPSLVDKVKQELNGAMSIAAHIPEIIEEEFTNPYDFPSFMSRVTSSVTQGKITHKQVLDIVKSFGLPSIHVVGTREDLIPGIMKALDEIIV